MRGHVEICKLLLEYGADKSLANKQGSLPIDNCQACYSEAYKYTQQLLSSY